MRSEEIPEPWASFLIQVDNSLTRNVELHCFGGFVVTLFYGLARSTADIDIFQATDRRSIEELMSFAGKGSALHLKHKIYLDFVSVASVPEDYELRLTEMFPGA